MKINTLYPGTYFMAEGIDTSGKSTQFNLAADYLQREGYNVLSTRQPGGTKIGQKIRQILLDPENTDLLPEVETGLYCLDRRQHMGQFVIPALQKQNNIVLQDRGQFATKIYQGYGRKLPMEMIDWLNNFAVGNYQPDSVLFFDISIREMEKRMAIRNKSAGIEKDRLEGEDMSFFNRVRQGMYECKKQNPDLITIINAERSIEEINKDVILHINSVIKEKKKILGYK